jgi:hypothetical protein
MEGGEILDRGEVFDIAHRALAQRFRRSQIRDRERRRLQVRPG